MGWFGVLAGNNLTEGQRTEEKEATKKFFFFHPLQLEEEDDYNAVEIEGKGRKISKRTGDSMITPILRSNTTVSITEEARHGWFGEESEGLLVY